MANPFKSKKFKYGGLSVLFVIICVVAVVLVNVIVTLVLDRFDVEIDLTSESLYSIEDSTVEYLQGIDDEVKIYITNTETDFVAYGTYYKQSLAIAKKIAAANSKFSIEYIDLLKNPAWASDYGESVDSGMIVVQSTNTKRYKVLQSSDYLETKYYYNGNELDESMAQQYYYMGYQIDYDVSAAAEESMLSAIMSVTNANPVKVAVITGYSEVARAEFADLLSTNAYVLEDINITLTDAISTDYDFAILCWPQTDYNNDDILKLEKWLSNDGLYGKTLMYMPAINQTNTPNFDAFLAEWGIQIEKGYLYQTNNSYASASNPYYMMLETLDSDFASEDDGYSLRCLGIRPVTCLWEAKGNYETKTLVSSYDGAVIHPFDAPDDWTVEDATAKGAYGVIVQSSEVRYDGTTPYYSRVIAVGTPYFADDSYMKANGVDNADFLMSVFNTISGKEEGVTLTSKSFSLGTFEINAATSNTIAIIFVIVLPLVIIVLGIVVYVRRRYR